MKKEEVKEGNTSDVHQKIKKVFDSSMPVDLKVQTGTVKEITQKEINAEFMKSQACVLCLPHIWPTYVRPGLNQNSEIQNV